VAEITVRARQIERLNQSLSERVHNRSQELALALARLAASTGQAVLQAGEVVGDRYEIERLIGLGGMGVVYAARDRRVGESVAVKLIRTADSVIQLQRFLDEARAAAAIDHPAIVRVLHVDVSEHGAIYQVLELVEGRSLEHVLAEEGLLAPEIVVRIGEGVAAGLAAAHARGIVHRDIKPANVMLTGGAPGVKVLDFGLAKLRRQPGFVETAASAILGTPGFLAPEQIATPDRITGAADVYALGATLYLSLAGKPPFAAASVVDVLYDQAHEAAPDLATRAPDVPAALAALVMECLALDAGARPTAAALAARLTTIATELGAGPLAGLAVAAERTTLQLHRREDPDRG
jgi:serine/threonine-protein kinase